jgi:hypothetical protein
MFASDVSCHARPSTGRVRLIVHEVTMTVLDALVC